MWNIDVENIEQYYRIFKIPKRRGYRIIHEPNDKLKAVQRQIARMLSHLFKPSIYATAYRKGIGIMFNAFPHRNKEVIVKMDIKNFYHSITKEMIVEAMKSRLNEDFIEEIAMICTVPLNGKRVLPMGAPTSPIISNIVMYKIDNLIAYVLKDYQNEEYIKNATYTRYADDITVSFNKGYWSPRTVETVIGSILKKHGFQPNWSKTKILYKNNRQIVTGIVVNETLSIPREKERIFRARLHNLYCAVVKDKKDPKNYIDEWLWIHGYYAYMISIHSKYRKRYEQKIEAIKRLM